MFIIVRGTLFFGSRPSELGDDHVSATLVACITNCDATYHPPCAPSRFSMSNDRMTDYDGVEGDRKVRQGQYNRHDNAAQGSRKER